MQIGMCMLMSIDIKRELTATEAQTYWHHHSSLVRSARHSYGQHVQRASCAGSVCGGAAAAAGWRGHMGRNHRQVGGAAAGWSCHMGRNHRQAGTVHTAERRHECLHAMDPAASPQRSAADRAGVSGASTSTIARAISHAHPTPNYLAGTPGRTPDDESDAGDGAE